MTFNIMTLYSVVIAVRADGIPLRGVFMLDLTGIVFSSVMMLVIIVRAVRLDRQLPWFQTIKVEPQLVVRKQLSRRRH